MKSPRITFAVAAAAGLVMSGPVDRAAAWPEKPIRLVVGFPAGGPNDTLGRLMAGWLARDLGQPINVENRGGNSGNIATAEVIKSAPDGYTLLLVGPANAIGPAMNPNLGFNFLEDIDPVGGITREALVLVVHPSVPAATAPQLIGWLKGDGAGKARMASTGNGSSPHVTGELFMMMTGIKTPVVHYGGGGPALKAMIAGEAELMFEPMSASIEPVRTGKLRALAVSTTARSSALPEVPPLADSVPGFDASAVTGIGAPRGTPASVVARLNTSMNAAFRNAEMQAKLADTGGEPLPGTPEAFGALMRAETEKWGKVVRFAKGTTK